MNKNKMTDFCTNENFHFMVFQRVFTQQCFVCLLCSIFLPVSAVGHAISDGELKNIEQGIV